MAEANNEAAVADICATPKAVAKTDIRVEPADSLAVRQKLDLLHRVNGGIEIHTGMESYTCMYCAKVFSDLRVLKSHVGIHTGERPFPCSHCQRCFKNKYQLRDHVRVHTGERPFQCPHCPKAFAQKNQLNLHLPTHNSERPFVCGLCGKSFKIATTLQTHLKFHSDERPYVCPVCQFAFHLPSLLRSHMRTHTGERPYPCKFCGKRFKTASTRKVHERSHEPEPAFKCPDCDRSFTYASNLAMHRRTHKEKDQHACNQCSQTFITPDSLRLHLESTHANAFKCSICKEGFSLKVQLDAHLDGHKAEAVAFTCYHCHKKFSGQAEYRTHMSCLPCVKLYGCGKCEQRFETISQLNGHMWSHKPPRSNRRGRPPKRYVETDADKMVPLPELPPLHPLPLTVDFRSLSTSNKIRNESIGKKDDKPPVLMLPPHMDKTTLDALSAMAHLPITYEPRLFCGVCFSEHADNEDLQEHLRKSHPPLAAAADDEEESLDLSKRAPVENGHSEKGSTTTEKSGDKKVRNRRMVHTVSSANHSLLQKYTTVSVSDEELPDETHFHELGFFLPERETSRRTKRLKQGWRGYIV